MITETTEMSEPSPAFRTIEEAQLPCQGGCLRFVTVKSRFLKGRGDVSIYVPRQAEGKDGIPVVILLHGVYCSHWAWALKGQAHLSLQEMIDAAEIPPMILAMPSDGLWGDGSAYLEHNGHDFERWIVDEVPALVSQLCDYAMASPCFLAGLSMGGYGALRLGARHPERFMAFSGHSSITRFEDLGLFVEEPLDHYQIGPADAVSVIKTIRNNLRRLRPFRFDCGTADPLIDSNRALAAALERESIDFVYEEFAGGHEWPYWVRHVRDSFRFFAGHLTGTRPG